jgi:hypothetical protein
MLAGGGADGAVGCAVFRARINEHAAVELLGAEPVAQHVEDRQQPLARRVGRPLHGAHEPVPEGLIAPPQHRQDQLVLGTEVIVEGHLRHPRLGEDPVDAGGVIAVLVEQPLGRLDEVLASRRGHKRAPGNLQTGLYIIFALDLSTGHSTQIFDEI